VIELHGVERDFQVGDTRVHALRDLDLDVADGEYVAVMGRSGSGKTTLLNVLGLLDRPDRGSYRLAGIDTGDLDEEARSRLRREHIGFVFQAFHLIPRLSAEDNVALPLLLAGVAADERRRRVGAIMASLGLTERAHHRPDQLSGGQRQRVAIARATITEPGLILADEPTGNLDHRSGAEVMRTLEALNERGITLMVVTHDPDLGARARRQIRMIDGEIADDQTG
jgi:putative ABC transport system ATP-binding protein